MAAALCYAAAMKRDPIQHDAATEPPPEQAPARPSLPATLALAVELDRNLATLRDQLSARIGAPVVLSFGDDGMVLSWRDGGATCQEAAWSLEALVKGLA